MRHTLYKYNAETCHYERIKVKAVDVVFYISGIIVVSLLMLAGILVLHDFMIDSEKEVTLRRENHALKKNQETLTVQLNTIESTLSELELQDQKLHTKFFGIPPEKTFVKQGSAQKNILLSDASSFRSAVEKIQTESSTLLHKSAQLNLVFANTISVDKEAMAMIHAMPNIRPVRFWKNEKLFSGFGMRVNPFHKGLYKHPGIDIAVPRGTEVIATAAGLVTEIKKSELQAGYGNYIEIDHGHGFITRYAHLEEIKVKSRQKISKGEVIALTGNSGGSIAPHLHYEIVRNGENVNPIHYMIEDQSSKDHAELKAISEKQNQSLD